MKYVYFLLAAVFLFLSVPGQAKSKVTWNHKRWEKQKTIIPYTDTMLGVAYIFESPEGYEFGKYILATMRPYIGFGTRPFVFLNLGVPLLDGLGFGFHTMIFSSGISMYYTHPKMGHLYLAWTLGWNRYGETLPGASLGIRF